MDHEFCPDCGHLLPKTLTRCTFCGWSQDNDDLAGRKFDPDLEEALVYNLTDNVYPGEWVAL